MHELREIELRKAIVRALSRHMRTHVPVPLEDADFYARSATDEIISELIQSKLLCD